MTLDQVQRLSEILLALTMVQFSVENIRAGAVETLLGTLRLSAALLLLSGLGSSFALGSLLALGLCFLWRFQGPYNGGSDLMSLLLTLCLWLASLATTDLWRGAALGYLGIQLTLCYFQSGWVKVINPAWRTGQALADVFAFSAYPVSESVRSWANYPRLLKLMAWSVFGFELLFPLALLHWLSLLLALVIAGSFHLANACLFGLNRFFWIWLSTYPIAWWWQGRVSQFLFQ